MTPLALGNVERQALADLRELASAHPVNVCGLAKKLKDPTVKAAHMAQMGRQTVIVPFGFAITYSVETGHPAGICRHMSMSSPVPGRAPSPEAVDMIAELLGFVGGHRAPNAVIWLEDLERPGGKPGEKQKAVNLVQPIYMAEGPQ